MLRALVKLSIRLGAFPNRADIQRLIALGVRKLCRGNFRIGVCIKGFVEASPGFADRSQPRSPMIPSKVGFWKLPSHLLQQWYQCTVQSHLNQGRNYVSRQDPDLATSAHINITALGTLECLEVSCSQLEANRVVITI